MPDFNAFIRYDPETGKMYWKHRTEETTPDERVRKSFNSRLAGAELRTVDGKGYLHFNLNKKFYRVHRVAWFLTYGVWPEVVDHINGDKTDNRISNLRSVTLQKNNMNQRMNRRNTSGVTGVYLNRRSGCWCAQMKFNGVTYHLGSSKNFFEAVCLRKSEEQRLGFSTDHGRRPCED